MESLIMVTVGIPLIIGGVVASFHYQTVHKYVFMGNVFREAPPEFLLLPLWGAVGIGGVFVILGFIG